jgi:hypothetical protein
VCLRALPVKIFSCIEDFIVRPQVNLPPAVIRGAISEEVLDKNNYRHSELKKKEYCISKKLCDCTEPTIKAFKH